MSIRIEPLDDGFLVIDARGPRIWRGAAVSLADADVMARHRLHPWTAEPPPGAVTSPEAEPVVHPLAERQFEQAAGDMPPCVGSLCGSD